MPPEKFDEVLKTGIITFVSTVMPEITKHFNKDLHSSGTEKGVVDIANEELKRYIEKLHAEYGY